MLKLEPPEQEETPRVGGRSDASADTSPAFAGTAVSPAAGPPHGTDSQDDDEAIFAEYYRMAQPFLASQSDSPIECSVSEKAIVPFEADLGFPDACKKRNVSGEIATAQPTPICSAIDGTAAANFPFGASQGFYDGSIVRKKMSRSREMVRVSVGGPPDRLYFRQLVRRARAIFESLRILLVCKDEEDARGVAFSGKKLHANLKAAGLMLQKGLWLNRDKRIVGPLRGIRIGDVFFFRIELCVLGIHGQVQAGIDHVPANGSESGEPIATSIVVSGGYEDDEDRGETLIYTGHGGRGKSKQCLDQTLSKGNLAMERSFAYGIEIRVIRALKSDGSPTGKIYVYDGLYKIENCWEEVGKSGFIVFKYKLVRLENQPKMGSAIIKLADELRLNMLRVRPRGIVSLDISSGNEKLPVSLYNDVDGDDEPLRFKYLAGIPPSPVSSVGCRCTYDCSSEGCHCVYENGGELPYDAAGALLRGRPMLHECGSSCCCPATCKNRVTQKGLRIRLEVFKSWERGWAIRPLELIRAGTFICEFSGLISNKPHPDLVNPNKFSPRWAEWGDLSQVLPLFDPPPIHHPTPPLDFSIDVSTQRNMACYLVPSHSPNVFVQLVVRGQEELPRLMIFALENIPPMRELCVDYGMGGGWKVSQR